jgi:phenylacetic acid degradation operon negative regulatory protein
VWCHVDGQWHLWAQVGMVLTDCGCMRHSGAVNPFSLEAVLPDIATDAVRLPRRQAGGSPQDTAVTLLADYTLRTRGWLPSAANVALLGEAGISAGNARTTLSRLTHRGVLESSQRGRNTAYRLTPSAATSLSTGGSALAGFTERAESWDGQWTLVAFSLPHSADAQRRALRGRLRWLGFGLLYDGLWISPQALPTRKEKELAQISAGAMTVFRAQRVEFAEGATRDPLAAWDLAAIAGVYEAYVDRWAALLPRVRAGDITGPEAVRVRTEVMDAYRQFVVLDPRLPQELMPAGWPRPRAREVFVAVYDGLAGAALAHVTEAVTQRSDQEPQVATHTVADLLAGIHHRA